MLERSPLVGRDVERASLDAALAACRRAEGGLVLVSGDAGVGKSRLVNEVLAGWDGWVVRGAATLGDHAYAPVVEVLRAVADHFGDDALADHAKVLLPELALPWRELDQAAIIAAVHRTLRHVSREQPSVVVLEDLHWANAATLELLPKLAALASQDALLLVGTYRVEELRRGHPLRSMRTELRRGSRLVELVLRPLTVAETAELLTALLGSDAAPALVTTVHDRSGGIPFFIEELAAALLESNSLTDRDHAVALAPGAEVPLPESVLDAVLARTSALRRCHETAVELAAVLGVRVDLPALAGLTSPSEVDHLLEAGLLVEHGSGAACFRHALVRDALYRAVPWARRRSHHYLVAEHLHVSGAAPEVVAEHWIAAHEPDRARPLLLAAAERCCAVHAYRDAAGLARRALAIWPAGADDTDRLGTLEHLADCAELCGEFAEACPVWEETAALCRARGDLRRAGAAYRRLANARRMLGDWQRSVAAREAAVEAFTAAGERAEAAVDRLALAEQLENASLPTRALDHVVAAAYDAETAGRLDLKVHALALQGTITAGLGQVRAGVDLAQGALDLALAEGLTEAAGASYYELAVALIYAADYVASAEAWRSAIELCRTHELADLEHGCLACMSVAVRFLGEWDRALAIADDVLADDKASEAVRMVAEEESGLIAALRGDRRAARGRLRRAATFGRDFGVFGIEVGATWGLGVVADLDGDDAAAAQLVSTVVERCAAQELSHFALPALRWCATYLEVRGDRDGLARCHRLVASAATHNTSPKVLSTLAYVGGEIALAEGDPGQAAAQFSRSVELLQGITCPFEQALTQLRWGGALARAGDRQQAIDVITSAYRTARNLGAKPLARSCVTELADMGEQVDRRLGRLAARTLEAGELTRREREVLRLVAAGQTNREIAKDLFVSTRTVDMHLRNLLRKLGSTSRTAAVRRAVEIGVLDRAGQPSTSV